MPHWQHEPDAETQCHRAVERFLARYDWRLLERAEFVRRAGGALRSGVATTADRAATLVYSQALYHACSGAEGRERQERGYAELYDYLYAIAHQRYPQEWAEVAQRALSTIFEAFHTCRAPETFFAFALIHLGESAKLAWREAARLPESLDAPDREGAAPLGTTLPDPRQSNPLELVIDAELRQRLRRSLDACRRRHRRATSQLDAVWLKFIEGLDDQTISRRLARSVKSIQEMRCRGLKLLYHDPDWRALGSELGMLPEE